VAKPCLRARSDGDAGCDVAGAAKTPYHAVRRVCGGLRPYLRLPLSLLNHSPTVNRTTRDHRDRRAHVFG
jgi:hypothetical protein